MNKAQIHAALVERLETEWRSLLASAQEAFETATDSEHQARSKYETFSLESSYLARGQAERVAGIRRELESLHALPVDDLAPENPVGVGSLIEVLGNNGSTTYLYLVPAAGGEILDGALGPVHTVSASSAYGKCLIGKRMGEKVLVTQDGVATTVRITEVW